MWKSPRWLLSAHTPTAHPIAGFARSGRVDVLGVGGHVDAPRPSAAIRRLRGSRTVEHRRRMIGMGRIVFDQVLQLRGEVVVFLDAEAGGALVDISFERFCTPRPIDPEST